MKDTRTTVGIQCGAVLGIIGVIAFLLIVEFIKTLN